MKEWLPKTIKLKSTGLKPLWNLTFNKWPLWELIHSGSRRSIFQFCPHLRVTSPSTHPWIYLAHLQTDFYLSKAHSNDLSRWTERLCFSWVMYQKALMWGMGNFFLCYSVSLKILVLLIAYNSSSEAILSCHTRFVLNGITSRVQTWKCFKSVLFRRAPARRHKPKRSKGGYCWAILSVITDRTVQALLSQGCPQTFYTHHIPADCI